MRVAGCVGLIGVLICFVSIEASTGSISEARMDGKSGGDLKEQIRGARRKFAAMAATYFSGVLNDNFFRQSAMLIAVTVGLTRLQGFAMVVFTLPYEHFYLFSIV